MFRLAQLIRLYLMQFTNWLVLTAFAIDQLSEILLKAAKRRCRQWLPIQSITVDKKGRIIKFGVKKHGIRL